MNPNEGDVIQVAYVVRDMERALKNYWEIFGIGPWQVYTFAPPFMRDSMVRGKPSDHSYLLAVTRHLAVQHELVQPLKGESIYTEHLQKKGEGLHHIKIFYPDLAAALARYAALGYQVIQSGKVDENEFYYIDTEGTFGYVIEIGNKGKIRPSERRYPA
jgi:methylmalonyl-CoA/ethylmalonyl-CoA epimerase